MLLSVLSIVLSFVLIWFTSDAIVKSVTRFAERMELSAFSASFILLGLLSSTPEFSIGMNAVLDGVPQVYIGNLMGGIVVLFCLVAPLLAIFGNGITINHGVTVRRLGLILILISIAPILTLRGYIDYISGTVMVLLYIGALFAMRQKKSIIDRFLDIFNPDSHPYNLYDVLRIIFGVVIIFFASKLLIDQVVVISKMFDVKPYLISLLALSIGSNLPELFIGILAVVNKQKEVAFGHYLGSAAANGFFLGLLTLFNGPVKIIDQYYYIVPVFIITSLLLFYMFVSKKMQLTRVQGIFLLMVYSIFVLIKIFV